MLAQHYSPHPKDGNAPSDEWMNKNAVHVLHVFSHKKELNTDACYIVDELPKHYAKWKKSHVKARVFNYVKFLE